MPRSRKKGAKAPATGSGKGPGRPQEYDRPTVAGRIFLAVAEGTLVVAACKAEGVSRSTLNAWCADSKELSDAYARAREQQAHALAEEVLAIANGTDDLTKETDAAVDRLGEKDRKRLAALDANKIQRDRLRVDSLKWYTSKIAPKLYGEKASLDVTSGGQPISGVVCLPMTGDEVSPP